MITLPANFEADIQGQNLNLYPIITIGDFFISTKSTTIDGNYYKPLLLNIPSISEKMDFDSRKYTISNTTLKLSNFEFEGERFSDYAGNLINTSVVIYWVSQSESMLEVYKGFVRRYSHDDTKCTLTLEDSSQKDLHRDVPVARLGDGDEILDKYKNKPIPMVYGHVDKSPCIIDSFLHDVNEVPSLCTVQCDDKEIESFNESTTDIGATTIPVSSLYFYKNDVYYNATQKLSGVDNFIPNSTNAEIDFVTDLDNLTISNALGVIIKRNFTDIESWTGYSNGYQGLSTMEFLNGYDEAEDDDTLFEEGTSNAIDGDDSTFCLISGSLLGGGTGEVAWLDLILEPFTALDPAEGWDLDGNPVTSPINTYLVAKVDHTDDQPDPATGFYSYWGIWHPNTSYQGNYISSGGAGGDIGILEVGNVGEGIGTNSHYPQYDISNDDYDSYSAEGTDDPHLLDSFTDIDQHYALRIGIPYHGAFYIGDDFFLSTRFKLYHAFIYHDFKTKGIKDKDFYANVNGRTDNTGFYE